MTDSEKNAEPAHPTHAQLGGIEAIKFVINDEIKETIKQAEVNAKKMIDNVDSCLIHFNEYGSNFLKSGTFLFCPPHPLVLMFLDVMKMASGIYFV